MAAATCPPGCQPGSARHAVIDAAQAAWVTGMLDGLFAAVSADAA